MDADTLREEDGYVRVWVREDLAAAQRDQETGRDYVSEITSVALDCGGRRYAITAYSRRDDRGAEVASADIPAASWAFSEAVPGTVAEGVLDSACRAYAASAATGDPDMLAVLTDPDSWQLLGTSEHQGNPTQLLILQTSIGRAGDVGWAVLQLRFARPQGFEDLPPAKYMLMRELVNCVSGHRAMGGMMLVGARGETILPFHEQKTLDPRPVQSGSPAAAVFDIICGGQDF